MGPVARPFPAGQPSFSPSLLLLFRLFLLPMVSLDPVRSPDASFCCWTVPERRKRSTQLFPHLRCFFLFLRFSSSSTYPFRFSGVFSLMRGSQFLSVFNNEWCNAPVSSATPSFCLKDFPTSAFPLDSFFSRNSSFFSSSPPQPPTDEKGGLPTTLTTRSPSWRSSLRAFSPPPSFHGPPPFPFARLMRPPISTLLGSKEDAILFRNRS